MTTLTDYRSAASRSKPVRIPADLVAVALWSLVGLMLCAMLAVSNYTPDLPVIQAMASG
jgi:hypothetical protein